MSRRTNVKRNYVLKEVCAVFPFFYDPTYILIIPALILALYAQFKVQSTFEKYLRVRASSNLTGAQVARELLDKNQLYDVPVEITPGRLSDHYDPRRRILRLSPDVYHGRSLAALGVAAHETGHAIQHANEYIPLNIRNAVFPVASFGSSLAFPLFFIGLLMGGGGVFLMDLGIILFSGVLFQVFTLRWSSTPVAGLCTCWRVAYLSRGAEVSWSAESIERRCFDLFSRYRHGRLTTLEVTAASRLPA